jgi:ribonucleoside-diphosphate reductase alpha chain
MDDPIVESILKERYYQPGESSWEDIAKRVAKYVSDDIGEFNDFYEVINEKKFIPNTPALMNAGTENPMLFACYCLGADDSIESIFETMKVSAKIMKLGGGIGIDWSHLRPEGALVHSTHGTSSGVIAFMRNFNEVIETVKSGGRRRGAGISILDVEHGDVDKFITCKNIEGTFANFNISVKITDHFMQNLDDPVYKNRLHNIATAMWTRSEPGILFIDTAKNALTVPEHFWKYCQ